MKYKLTEETRIVCGVTLHRIQALKSFGDVKEGDLGGWIEKEFNLSQENLCWLYGNASVYGDVRVSGNARVYGDAWLYGDARVFGNARVYGNASVYGNARVSGDASVYGNARVFGNARVSGDARVYGDVRVSGNARVYGNARVFGNARVCKGKHEKIVINLILSKHSITIDGKYLNIGCCSFTVKQWLKNYQKIGKSHGYSDEEIEEYGEMIKTISKIYFKENIQ